MNFNIVQLEFQINNFLKLLFQIWKKILFKYFEFFFPFSHTDLM